MSGMRTMLVDKLASVTQACGLSHEVRITPEIVCEEGNLVVVEVLNDKSTYNTLELTSGRMAKVSRGVALVAAAGPRREEGGSAGPPPSIGQRSTSTTLAPRSAARKAAV
jgi:hypothetical protein